MQPFAFGRFAIDLPAAARLRGRSHTIAHLSVAAAEQHDGETPRSLLEAKVAERSPARIHRAHLHGPEMVSVVHHDDPDTPDSVFMEALRIAGGSVFKVSGANVIDKVDALEQAALQIGMAIVPTLDADPAVPGFCVERGVVAMGFFWEESATAVFDCDGTTLVLGSHSNADALPRSLLAKHAAAAPQLGAHGVSTVRSGRRTLFELSGEEIVLRSPSSAMVKWECVGKPRSADHPALSIQLEMKDGADLATVLAMWGELAASFRRRTR